MEQQHDPHERDRESAGFRWVFIGFLLVAGYFLFMEHRAHLSGWLSSYGVWLLLLACPLMHLFMHRGHRGHSPDRGSSELNREDK